MEPKLNTEVNNENSGTHAKSKEPILARYVRRHHAPNQINGDNPDGTMTRKKLRGTCLLAEFEPRNVKDALEDESWIEVMNEKIEKNLDPCS